MQPNANPNLSPTHMCNPNPCGQQSCIMFGPLSCSTEGHGMKPDIASTEVHYVPYRLLQTNKSVFSKLQTSFIMDPCQLNEWTDK